MKLIMLSGGSGKRLWPLSNDSRSKQFLKIFSNETGHLESMVQRVWRQLDKANLHHHAYIATSYSQTEILQSQIGTQVKMIVEPERRDTFPAIVLSCLFLFDKEYVDPDETICVMPVDPYVDQTYFEKFAQLEEALGYSSADLVLMGVIPTYPSEKYGYILLEPGHEECKVQRVRQFIEKPNSHVAKELLEQHALWNCGVFTFKLRFILDIIKDAGYPLSYDWAVEHYSVFTQKSFDYEVVEKAHNIVAVPYQGSWKDLGTWNTITDEIKSNVGRGIQNSDCENTHIINELDIPIIAIGTSDTVIAASPDGILVSNKAQSPKIKDIVLSLNQRPMYEERLWGWYRILDFTKNQSGEQVLTKRVGIHAGCFISYQTHYLRTEIWTIVSGSGECVIDGVWQSLNVSDIVTIPAGKRHAVRASESMEMIEVQIGRELIEEDIHREVMDWQDVLKICQTR
jgi:mannose-1-phosphate guanylyltransferase